VTECLSTSHGSSCGSSRHSSSTTSPTLRDRVPWHVPQLVTRLVVDYFDYAARLGALARRAARHAAGHQLLRLRRASGCHDTSLGLLSTTSPTPRDRVPRHVARLVVDYFAYAARPGASARRAARRRLIHLRRVTGCLSTSRDSSRGSSQRSSPTTSLRLATV
jgi:hypothetical protein